ncbi:glucan endo-1,3-beta-glucosidase-like [Typha angustifolia]|uniref:glucan endo-1,3-beta-glucosidase-like n=1 Tax=Typha angustifolia TaxID=59011 RepID=UPI003C2AF7ED
MAISKVGVCYGMLGDNLPRPSEVINLYKSKGVTAMRIYDPNADALNALRGTGIQLIVGVPNDQLGNLGSASGAAAWLNKNVIAYPDVSFRYIAVGNEVVTEYAHFILPAMKNVYAALSSAGLQDKIKVSTAVAQSVLGSSYPPSNGDFSSEAKAYMGPIVQFLASHGAPLLANVYPYFSYVGNPKDISLGYALFTSPGTVVQDGRFGYQNLFDAILDAIYAALERAGGANVEVVVSESGWPSAGGTAATVGNARTYNQNLINHVGQGTPRRSGKAIQTYIFAMFNENQKTPPGIENNFGLFYPNKQPVYQINFR